MKALPPKRRVTGFEPYLLTVLLPAQVSLVIRLLPDNCKVSIQVLRRVAPAVK